MYTWKIICDFFHICHFILALGNMVSNFFFPLTFSKFKKNKNKQKTTIKISYTALKTQLSFQWSTLEGRPKLKGK